jgi:hypothetical protein
MIYDIQQAGAELRHRLGAATQLRTAVLLPSGLVFVVGRNGEHEAAVYLTFFNAGPGVGSFDKRLPESGRLFTPQQLARLFS